MEPSLADLNSYENGKWLYNINGISIEVFRWGRGDAWGREAIAGYHWRDERETFEKRLETALRVKIANFDLKMTGTWNTIYDWSVQVWFRIEKDEDGYPRSKNWEQLLAWPVLESDRCFRIESIPFFVKGISRGDIVAAKVSENNDVQEGEFLEFESIVERGGHNTYRLLLRERYSNEPDLTKKELLSKGLALEVADGDFFCR